jgi:GT2 family glycosyltransferase
MSEIKVSWVLLTLNRQEMVKKAFIHNKTNAGYPIHEVVWCDNGSTDNVRDFMLNEARPDVCILNKNNLGVSPGYNRVMALASGTHIVITGCDMMMPTDWLRIFVSYFNNVPKTGIACMYSGPFSWVKERLRGPETGEVINDHRIVRAMPIGRRMFSKWLLGKIGYLREDFGLYGWEDVEWGYRAERVCKELGLNYYAIPNSIADHLGTEGNSKYDTKDDKEYWAFKQNQVQDQKKKELLNWCQKNNYPYYNPYAAT